MSQILFRCHYASDFMSEGKAKNPYQQKLSELEKERTAIDNLKTEAGKEKRIATGVLHRLEEEVRKLLPLKDEIYFSETGKQRIRKVVREIKYNISERLDNKKLRKGIMVEDDSIALLSRVTGEFYTKNTQRFKDHIKQGEMDIIGHKKVIDIKSSWDMASFHSRSTLPKSNYWQAQGYIDLLRDKDAQMAQVAYCLSNTPIDMVRDEVKNQLWSKKPIGISMDDYMLCDELEGVNLKAIRTQIFRNHTFSDDGWIIVDGEWQYLEKGYWEHLVLTELLDEDFEFIPIPDKHRVKIFQFNKDPYDIELLNKRMIKAREEVCRLLDADPELEIIHLTKELCNDKALSE